MKEAMATVQMLARGVEADTAAEWRRLRARAAWCMAMTEKWRAAMHQRDDRCTAAVEHLSEEAFEQLYDAEQAKVDAIKAELDAVIEHDRWPRHLYWGAI